MTDLSAICMTPHENLMSSFRMVTISPSPDASLMGALVQPLSLQEAFLCETNVCPRPLRLA